MKLFQNIPLLPTKLNRPQQPSYHIPREHLMAGMSKALSCKVTFVTSPPGFGKTTLVGEWLLHGSVPVAWVSLDQGENDMLRFWTYVIAAFHRLYPALGHKSLSLLRTISFSAEEMIDWLLHDLFDIRHDVLLVLDDYHVIDSQEIHSQVAYFLDRMPPHVHLILLSRKQPPIAVGKLRARGQLCEIGLKDLRFSPDEMKAFWLKQTGDTPSEAVMQLLTERTEGWAAGVQLAVLTHLSGHPQALNDFKGNHRYVVDYLMEEVFDHMPDRVRSFLVKTSVAERMNAGLCSALIGRDVQVDELQDMEKANLFVIPLDAERHWYRYHHLFASFLRSKLEGAEASGLHRAACEWFAEQGFTAEAVEHALSAAAYGRAAGLILQSAPEMLKRRELATLHRWLLQLPSAVRERPEMLMIQVWTELLLGRKEQTEVHIHTLHRALQLPAHALTPQLIGVREDLKVVRCFQAMLAGDFPLCYSLLQQMCEEESLPDLQDVPMLFSMGVEMNAGSLPLIRSYYGFRGRIKQAKRYHRLYGSFIDKHGFHDYPFTAYQRAALSEVCYEQNRLDEALRWADDAVRLARLNRVMGAYVPAEIVRSKITRDREGAESALAILREAMAYVNAEDLPGSRWHDLLYAYYIRCRLEVGITEDTGPWMAAASWGKRNEMIGDQDDELLTFIRVLMAGGDIREALLWCAKLMRKAQSSGSIMTEIEVRLCLAQIHHWLDEPHTSLLQLHKALCLGEQEGYLRIFAGKELSALLTRYAEVRRSKYMPDIQSDGVSLSYLQSIVSIAQEGHAEERQSASSVHTLTPREREVLQLMAEGLSNKAIAERLVLSEGTVKLHLHRIYSKLQVNGRVQAVQKANESKI
ncbi:LuxR C-terminal-related transcriptional regulator [Bacillus sp. 3255]|uniref:helix-turn-helix transcriptional regulator n=1 Tax=Bacillus sp. 3255 TaxID=2817904 RepID=UPI002866EB2B|nr:LuxR C-terminal-related transcriptional regulator [Bacillus sp. 3255]MDR6878263.1 LuxR family maltose regulon positive regulatory protein [Bacillus sp. 3255]